MLAIVVNVSEFGSHISAASTGQFWLSYCEPQLPPVTRTFPSGRIVVFGCRLGLAIALTGRQAGEALVMSITSALAVGGSPPPAINTLPTSYMTPVPSSRNQPDCVLATGVQLPVPDVSK